MPTMNLYIFNYDNGVDFNDTHWAKGHSEDEARVALKGRDAYGTKRLGRSYKLVATFPLAAQQNPANPKETEFPVKLEDDPRLNQMALNHALSKDFDDPATFRAGVQWLLDKIHQQGSGQ